MSIRWMLFGATAIACALPASGRADVVLEGGDVRLVAPGTLDCDDLPLVRVEGLIAGALAGDRAALADVVGRMSLGIATACPEAEALAFEGIDRDVTVTFRTTKEGGWRMPGAADPKPPAAEAPPPQATATVVAPAEPAAAPATSPPETAELAEEEPAPPPIAPGIGFNDLAQFYGPVPMVRGHALLNASETWTRILAARAYAERPDLIQDDALAIEIAQQMLNPVEFQALAAELAPILAQGGSRNLSVFQRRDLAERVRNQARPFLDQRRQTGPIDVYHAIPLQLGEYSFERQAFPFRGGLRRDYRQPQWRSHVLHAVLDGVAFPTELRSTVDEARQIDDYLRARGDATLYLGVFLAVDPRVPENIATDQNYGGYGQLRTPTAVKQVGLFVDEALTQMLFDFTPALAQQQAAIAAVDAELSRPTLTAETLVRSLDRIGNTTSGVAAIVSAFAQQASQQQEDPEAAQALAERAFARARPQTRARLMAQLQFEPYDARLGGLPVRTYGMEQPQFGFGYISSNLDLTTFPQLTVLPVSQDAAAAILAAQNNRGLEVRLEADIVQGNVQSQNGYVRMTATMTPRRVLVFSGQQNTPVADRALLADVALAEAPSLPVAPFSTFGATTTP